MDCNESYSQNESCQNQNGHKECRFILDGLSPQCGAVLAPIIASILAEGLNANQIATLGAFLDIVADSLSYISAQMQLNEGITSDQTDQSDKF